jgi:hypothetical protein
VAGRVVGHPEINRCKLNGVGRVALSWPADEGVARVVPTPTARRLTFRRFGKPGMVKALGQWVDQGPDLPEGRAPGPDRGSGRVRGPAEHPALPQETLPTWKENSYPWESNRHQPVAFEPPEHANTPARRGSGVRASPAAPYFPFHINRLRQLLHGRKLRHFLTAPTIVPT